MNQVQSILLGVLVIFIIVVIIYYLLKRGTETTTITEVVTSEDDPQLQVLAECRSNLIDQIATVIAMTWNFPADKIDIDYKLVDFGSNLIIISYSNYLCRLYCNWHTNKIKLELSYYSPTAPQKYFVKTTILRMKNGFINISKLEQKLQKWYYEFSALLYDTFDEKIIVACSEGITIARSKDFTDDEIIKLLFDAWNNFEIRKSPKKQFIDIGVFNRLTAYIVRFHPEEFTEYVKAHQKLENENENKLDKEEENK